MVITMRLVKFYGSSDDLFEVETNTYKKGEPDEINCSDGHVELSLEHPNGQAMRVIGHYTVGGQWSVGIAPWNDDWPFPDWAMLWGFLGHSATLLIELPNEVVIKEENLDD
jgi:hypothetical protein